MTGEIKWKIQNSRWISKRGKLQLSSSMTTVPSILSIILGCKAVGGEIRQEGEQKNLEIKGLQLQAFDTDILLLCSHPSTKT